jgi:cyclic dehypoxanthinyl futalosine synthase
MNYDETFQKALRGDVISLEEGLELYQHAPAADLIFVADQIRKKLHPENVVTWIIDRNINISNVCIARCKFCNFHCVPKSEKAYITTLEEYQYKIDGMRSLGGNQLLLQGGLHPDLGLDFYKELFSNLKGLYPDLKLHALGPAEIHHLSKMEKMSYTEVLTELVSSGMDSLPGAGAEILSNRVRKLISPGKCSADEWLEVMKAAHKLGILTSATMMFGHLETPEERVEHLEKIRKLQNEKPVASVGFISFIPWPFQDEATVLKERKHVSNSVSANDYVRLIAFSRIFLTNIRQIQASWLTVGKDVGQLCLHAGANDFGSIMIEENVVSSAGAKYSMNKTGIQQAIKEAGFIPKLRNQRFNHVHKLV